VLGTSYQVSLSAMIRTAAQNPFAPAVRERYYAPVVLFALADDMARRMARLGMGPVLETMADTGALTQALATALSAGIAVIATDPYAPAVAQGADKPGMARVTWRQADPDKLPFDDASFGIVTSHFGVCGMPDRVRAFGDARRVLKSGGRFVFSVPGHLRYNPVANSVQNAMQEMFPNNPPQYLSRVLHGYADNELIDNDLTAAGFTDAIYTAVDLPFTGVSAYEAAMIYCLGTPMRAEIEMRMPGGSERVAQQVAVILARQHGSGAIASTMRGHIISASG
jgi:ubiquinone/menaquinone biosynthesis C-methylase UbiE